MQLGFHTDAFEQLDVGDVDGKSGPEVPTAPKHLFVFASFVPELAEI